MEKKRDLQEKIAAILQPKFAMPDDRRAILDTAFLGNPEILGQINYDSTPATFTSNLIHLLERYGTLDNGQEALVFLLQFVKKFYGVDRQREIDTVIEEFLEQRFRPKGFDNYTWDLCDLKDTKAIEQGYVQPYCQKENPRTNLTNDDVEKEPLFSAIDTWLSDFHQYKYILLMAGSGMGKSICLLNYFLRSQKASWDKDVQVIVLPLCATSINRIIEEIPNPGKTALFLDALDEDPKAWLPDDSVTVGAKKSSADEKERINPPRYHDRLVELCELTAAFHTGGDYLPNSIKR